MYIGKIYHFGGIDMEIKKKGMKFWIIVSAIALVFLILIGSMGYSSSQSKQAKAEVDLEKKDKK